MSDGCENPWDHELLKPVSAQDDLAALLDEAMMNKLIKYLQDSGFSSELQEKKCKGCMCHGMHPKASGGGPLPKEQYLWSKVMAV